MSSPQPPALVVGTGFGCRIQVPALRAGVAEMEVLDAIRASASSGGSTVNFR